MKAGKPNKFRPEVKAAAKVARLRQQVRELEALLLGVEVQRDNALKQAADLRVQVAELEWALKKQKAWFGKRWWWSWQERKIRKFHERQEQGDG